MVETLGQLLLHNLRSFPKNDFMLHKVEGRYVPISTEEFATSVRHLTLGLKDLGFSRGDKMALLSENGPGWVMADFACLCAGGITVPIYTTLTPEQIKYIIDNSDAKFVVCGDARLWANVETIREELSGVEHFVLFEPDGTDGVFSLEALLSRGKAVDAAQPAQFESLAAEAKPDDTATIIYTSGTTGPPKGVMLSHHNLVSNVKSVDAVVSISDKDVFLSFLPLSHSLERWATYAYIYKGCTIAYAERVDTVGENMIEIRPTAMVCVPRIWEKIYARIMDSVLAGSVVKKKIFFWAIKTGKACGRKRLAKEPVTGWLDLKRKIAHKLVFSKILEKTGGRARLFVSGGAALAKDIGLFFHALGLTVLEGYGLTETSPVISCNNDESLRFGTVGKPVPDVKVKIAEDGEILMQGPNLMKGYYKMEEATREAMAGGWFHTGDIGHFDEDGFLVITDRKKDILVTSGGKNVAPQPIENLIKLNPYIENALVVGDGRKFVSALVVPDFDKLEAYAESSGIVYRDRQDLIGRPEVCHFLKAEVDRSTPDLASYERIKKITLLDRDFEIETGEMTPSLKVKRNIVEKKYRALIDRMYLD